MVKEIKRVIVECDICGRIADTRMNDYGNGCYERVLPTGWLRSETNSDFCICNVCWNKLTREGDDEKHA